MRKTTFISVLLFCTLTGVLCGYLVRLVQINGLTSVINLITREDADFRIDFSAEKDLRTQSNYYDNFLYSIATELRNNESDSYLSNLESSPDDNIKSKFLKDLGAPEEICREKTSVYMEITGDISNFKSNTGDAYAVRFDVECGGGHQLRIMGILGLPADSCLEGMLTVFPGTAQFPSQFFGSEEAGAQVANYHRAIAEEVLGSCTALFVPLVLTDLRLDTLGSFNSTRNERDKIATAIGLRLLGIEVWAYSNIIQHLSETLSENRLPSALYGVSLGGKLAYYTAAASEEINVVVVSAWLQPSVDKWLNPEAPGFLPSFEDSDYAVIKNGATEWSVEKLVQEIEPRPLMIEMGELDRLSKNFPVIWHDLQAAYPYWAMEAGRLCYAIAYDAGHQMIFEDAFEFIQFWLNSMNHSDHGKSARFVPDDRDALTCAK